MIDIPNTSNQSVSSQNHTVTVFMGGDIFSEPGLRVLETCFPAFKVLHKIDFCIINGENALGGFGIGASEIKRIFDAGFDVITGGNHTFENRDVYPLLNSDTRLLRPANYPTHQGCPSIENSEYYHISGSGFGIYIKNDISYAVLNIQGRESMTAIDCPFHCALQYALQAEKAQALLCIDFHAESNEEKEALAIFLDGKASAICGTHTHVQTADERILPSGTAYITDLGMTGAHESVIGSHIENAIKRNITQVPCKISSAEQNCAVEGVLIHIDVHSKKALSIERVRLS